MDDYIIDRSESQDTELKATYPRWFYTAMVGYVSRNSIRFQESGQFRAYLVFTWAEQSYWLREDNIAMVLRAISKDLPYPRLPTDAEWAKFANNKPQQLEDINWLAKMSNYLSDTFMFDKPEINAKQQLALDSVGGINGLLSYAESYGLSSAMRRLEVRLGELADMDACQEIQQTKIGSVDLTKLFSDKRIKNDE